MYESETKAHISNIENGNKNLTFPTITKLAKALDVSVNELQK